MTNALIETHYLPCLEYFTATLACDEITLEVHENYQKQSYRNRCRILSAGGVLELSIPIRKTGGKMKITEAKIDYQQKWVKDHWRTIRTSYGNAPFFEHFAGYFEEIYQRKYRYLLDLNIAFFELCWKLMRMDKTIQRSEYYQPEGIAGQLDLRSRIHPKNTSETKHFYKPCNYNQIFGRKFAGNLSIIDLLFCEGPDAFQILLKSKP